jgi:hypothetical protein
LQCDMKPSHVYYTTAMCDNSVSVSVVSRQKRSNGYTAGKTENSAYRWVLGYMHLQLCVIQY